MRWGVRKARLSEKRPDIRGIRGPKNEKGERLPKTSDSKKVGALKRREPHQLTNKQLEAVNKRLNLEKNYNKLNPNAIKRGAVAAAGLLALLKSAEKVHKWSKTPEGQKAIAMGKKALQKKLA